MKKIIFAAVLAAVLIVSCNSREHVSAAAQEREIRGIPAENFLDITGKEWKLTEVWINGFNSNFSRETVGDAFKEAFLIGFDAEMVFGTGAPNRFSAPYSLGENQTINIGLVRSTMMASIFEPEGLSEHNFFNYVQNSFEWKLSDRELHLHSKTDNIASIVLVFE